MKKKMKKEGREKETKGWDSQYVRVCVKASPAEGRRRLHTNTAHARLSGFNRLHVKNRRRGFGVWGHQDLGL